MDTVILGYSHTVVENCEDDWVNGAGGNTSDAEPTIIKVGSGSVKLNLAAGAGVDDLIATEDITSADLSLKTHLAFWFRSSIALAAGDIQIGISATSALGGTPIYFNVPAITTVDSWHRMVVALSGTRTAIVSVGFRQHVDVGAATFYVDDIRAFIGRSYSTLGCRGVDDPDEVIYSPGTAYTGLDGSKYEVIVAYQRVATVDFGVVSTKTDRLFLHTFHSQSDKCIYYNNEECSVVNDKPDAHANEWIDGFVYGRSFTVRFIEQTSRTTDPPSWSR
jgi:hypothetical protein